MGDRRYQEDHDLPFRRRRSPASRRPVIRLQPTEPRATEATELHELASGDCWALGLSSRSTGLLSLDDVDTTLPLPDGKVGSPTIELTFDEMRYLARRLLARAEAEFEEGDRR